jgi:nicotinamidase-related amidase
MRRARFALDTAQLELLLAFEHADSLQQLADTMVKDPSVISRNLQRIAEAYPVIIKVRGRWQLTALGQLINARTREFLAVLQPLLHQETRVPASPFLGATLLIINAQAGLSHRALANRSNPQAEATIHRLLQQWRQWRWPVAHVPHHSSRADSLFAPEAESSHFIPELAPQIGELVIAKSKSSAFADTALLQEAITREIKAFVIVGFTANMCIDATAREASELGFANCVLSDATASFDVNGPDGKLHRADRIHELTMANLHALCSTVITTDDLLNALSPNLRNA